MSMIDGEIWSKVKIHDGDYKPEIDYIVCGGYVFKRLKDAKKYCSPAFSFNRFDGEVQRRTLPMRCLECGDEFKVVSSWEHMYLVAEHLNVEHPEIFFEALILDELEER